jgi:hypothetical protein
MQVLLLTKMFGYGLVANAYLALAFGFHEPVVYGALALGYLTLFFIVARDHMN